MGYLIFVLIFVAGLLITLLISDKFNAGELLGLPFIIGLGYSSFVMFFLDALKIGISYNHLFTALAITVIIAAAALAFLLSKQKRSFIFFKRENLNLTGLTLPWLCFFGFGAYLAYSITVKCLYWPPAEFDSIEGYDLLAKAIAREGTIANSILLNPAIVGGCGPRLLYPPLFASCNAICYMSGMESPKLITAIIFISGLITFYSFVKRFVPHTMAAFATFMMMIAPEMFANASFTLTNLPTAVYASTAVIAFYIWRELKIEGFFYLSILTLIFATWTRSDAIVFYPPIMLILLYNAWRTKGVKHLLLYGVVTIIPFVFWHFYLTAHIERQQDSFFITKLFFDGAKLHEVFGHAWVMLTTTNLYGIVFYLFMIVFVVVHIILLILYFTDPKGKLFTTYKNHDFITILLVSLGGWFLYTMLYYQMKDTDGSLFASGGWMLSGFKRGMFSFVPLAMFYCVTNQLAISLFNKVGSLTSNSK